MYMYVYIVYTHTNTCIHAYMHTYNENLMQAKYIIHIKTYKLIL